MYNNLFKYLVIIVSFSSLSCSVELLNFKKENEKLHLELILDKTRFNLDSLALEKVTIINESTPIKKTICDLSKDIVLEEKSFWSSLNFVQSDVRGIEYNYYHDYPLSFNNDSSFALLVTDDITGEKDLEEGLFLINKKSCTAQKIINISSPYNYVSERIPFTSNEKLLYFVGNPAKWINNNSFMVCTNDSVIIFNTNDINNSQNIMEANLNSNYQVIDSLIIDQSTQKIEVINFNTQKKSIFFDEAYTSGLNKTKDYVYFIKGWSLYRCPVQGLKNPIKIFKGENTIKDYLILNDEKFIIRCGSLTDIPEQNSFYLFNLNENETILIDKTSQLKSYDLTTDKNYFIIRKKIIQIRTYYVLSVFDLQNKRKYEFDDETFPDK